MGRLSNLSPNRQKPLPSPATPQPLKTHDNNHFLCLYRIIRWHFFHSSKTPNYSIFHMKNTSPSSVAYLLILISLVPLLQACTVCQKCTNCTPDIMADSYLDGVDAILQNKLFNLGYPVLINRKPNTTDITYNITYSNGLTLLLCLNLGTKQIQLISYSDKPTPAQAQGALISTSINPPVIPNSSSSNTSKPVTTPPPADGYYAVANFTTDKQISAIAAFITQIAKANIGNFKLATVSLRNSTKPFIYRFTYQILAFSNLAEDVYVQMLANNSYQIVTANYSSLGRPTYTQLSPKAVTTDPYLVTINSLILKSYANILGRTPAVVDVLSSPPYYQITYQVDSFNYTISVVYDYLQSLIIQGNMTYAKATAAVAFSTASTSDIRSALIKSLGINASSTQSSGQGWANSSAQRPLNSSFQGPLSPAPSGLQDPYQLIANPQNSQLVNSIFTTLSTPAYALSPSDLVKASLTTINGTTYYRIIVTLDKRANPQVSRPLLFQFTVSSNNLKTFVLVNSSYFNPAQPKYVNLTLSDIQNDPNIQLIARYLLQTNYALASDSQLLLAARDFPYYRLVFDNQRGGSVTSEVLYNFYSSEVKTVPDLPILQHNGPQSNTTTTPNNTNTTNANKSTATNGSAANQTITNTSTATNASAGSQSNATNNTSSNATANPSNATLAGFSKYNSSINTAITTYVVQGMQKVSNTLTQQGFKVKDIVYQDILYKVDTNNTLTIVFKVSVYQKNYSFQYKGTIDTTQPVNTQSNTATSFTNTSATASINNTSTPNIKSNTSSSQTSNSASATPTPTPSSTDDSVVVLQGITYLKTTTLTSQNYITLYLKYLSSDAKYQPSNLIGIYINPQSPNSLLFRYYFNTQYYNVLATTSDIQQALTPPRIPVQPVSNNPTTPSAKTNYSVATLIANSDSTLNYGGIIYIKASNLLTSQPYITQYLNYLTANYNNYQFANLVGIYVNPSSPNNTIIFRFKYNNQLINLLSNVQDIQQLLNPAKSSSNVSSQTSATVGKGQTNTTAQTSSTITQPSPPRAIVSGTQGSTQQTTASNASSQSQNQGQKNASSSSTLNLVPVNPTPAGPTTTITPPISGTNIQLVQVKQLNATAKADPYCLCYNQTTCLRCAHRFYLNNNNCIQIPKTCLSYDLTTGTCVSCVPGYQINGGTCQLEQPIASYVDNQCLVCFANYKLVNGRCVYSPASAPSDRSIQSKNILCFSWKGTTCTECLPGTYLSSRGICELIDPFCSLFDYVQELCNTCQKGYSARNGRCFKI